MKTEREQKARMAADNLTAKQNSFERITEKACPQCNHVNDEGAFFCEECGAGLQKPTTCPKCNAPVQIRADICEMCGEWLLKGQCKFCYAHIADDEAFCGECGNPSEGVVCPTCGKLSIFDFCKTCGIPLSAQAKEMVRETSSNPDFQEIASIFEEFAGSCISLPQPENEPANITTAPYQPSQDDNRLHLKSYREASRKSVAATKPKSAIFSNEQKYRISRLNEEVLQEEERRRQEEERKRREAEERRRQEEERRRREEEERRQEAARKREEERRLQERLNEAMHQFRGKTFSTNQEARRFFMNLVAVLPGEVARQIPFNGLGWRCNAYDCVHDSPNDCADPSRGGVWFIR